MQTIKRNHQNMNKKVRTIRKDNLVANVYENVREAGSSAAQFVAEELNQAIRKRGKANLILATGASQFLFLEALQRQSISWDKITVFHLDEYKGMPETHPASFRKYLKERILAIVKPFKVYYLEGDAKDIDAEMARYERLLKENPVDVACVGIGENGHIAFNDPPVADFNDPRWVKVVQLDEACRTQQLGEGWFANLDEVPREALSLTIPAIMASAVISCAVPDLRKAQAVYDTMNAEISTDFPSTILRQHPRTRLFLDNQSASKII